MNIQQNVSLAPYSTFRIGGSVDEFIEIASVTDMKKAFAYIKETNKNFLVIGGGSNLVFSDNGFRGVVLHCNNRNITYIDSVNSIDCTESINSDLENNSEENKNENKNEDKSNNKNGSEISNETSESNEINENCCVFECESGVRMTELFIFAKKKECDFSVFSTIPGTVGGAVAGNAGLPHNEMSDIFVSAEVFDIHENKMITVSAEFFQFAYRSTVFHSNQYKSRYIIWSVKLVLPCEKNEVISQKAKEYMKSRKEKQPWGKTGGSFFANPEQGAAGFFLEKAGLKGYTKNGAFFSEKHANFMMNDGTATQQSLLDLEKYAKTQVKDLFDVELRREVRCIDEFGELVL